MNQVKQLVVLVAFFAGASGAWAQGVNTNLFESNQIDFTYKVKKAGLFSKAESEYLLKVKATNNNDNEAKVGFSVFIYNLAEAVENTGVMEYCIAPGKRQKVKVELTSYDLNNSDYSWVFDDINVEFDSCSGE